MGCFVRGGKSLWDVLSGVAKNGMGCFVPGCFVRLPYQTAPDVSVFCLLRNIAVPIFEVNTMSYLAASVTNTTIYLFKCIVVIQKSVAPGQLYASLGLSSSPLLIKKSIWPH